MRENALKRYLETGLGVFGVVLYIIIVILTTISLFVPLLFINGSIWIYIILSIILLMPGVGGWMEFALWCMTLPHVIAEPITTKVIIYYVALGIYAIKSLIPTIITIVLFVVEKIQYMRK